MRRVVVIGSVYNGRHVLQRSTERGTKHPRFMVQCLTCNADGNLTGQAVLNQACRICVAFKRVRGRLPDPGERDRKSLKRLRAEAAAAGLLTIMPPNPCKYGHLAPIMVSSGGCTECGRERGRRTKRTRDPIKRLRYLRKYYENNKEKIKALTREYRARKKQAIGRHTAAEIAALLKKQGYQCVYCKASIKNGYEADHIIAVRNGGTNWISNIQLTCKSCNCRKSAKDPIKFANERGLLL